VYVAPTKALVNQVFDDVNSKFKKTYKNSQVMAGRFTRDFRDNELDCQILVTVPQCLDIMLLSQNSQYSEWAKRVQYVIFDEVHCIGEEDGDLWERLLVFCPCPLLALSATIGNVHGFYSWLRVVEEAKERQLYLVQNSERSNDLQMWMYDMQSLKIEHISPACVAAQEYSLPEEYLLLPEDSAHLFEDMRVYLPEKERERLAPENFFEKRMSTLKPNSEWFYNLNLRDVRDWGVELKKVLATLPLDTRRSILSNMSDTCAKLFREQDKCLTRIGDLSFIYNHLVGLCGSLKHAGMLPALGFHMSRRRCEKLALYLDFCLRKAETQARSVESWDKKVKRAKDKLTFYRQAKSKSVWVVGVDDDLDSRENDEGEKAALQKLRELRQVDARFAFFGDTRVTEEDIEESARGRDFGKWKYLLMRGIGVHHSGMPKKYRQAVERLFREKKLGIVFCTSTLAMGINMPARTSIFIGDAIFINAMSFRQMSGRAGRRGLDLRGNVVFYGMRSQKVLQLLRSSLPSLNGNVVVRSSLVLRLLAKCSAEQERGAKIKAASHSGESAMTVSQTQHLLRFPLFEPNKTGKHALFHQFRMSVEFLLQEGLLAFRSNNDLICSGMGLLVCRLFYLEPGNFALCSLLKGGLLSSLDDKQLVVCFSHFFCQIPLSGLRWGKARVGPKSSSSPSVIVLPDLPPEIQLYLSAAQKRAVSCAARYTYVMAKSIAEREDSSIVEELPWTRVIPVPEGLTSVGLGDLSFLCRDIVLSSGFAGLDGVGDSFTSVEDLSARARCGILIDKNSLPVFEVSNVPLNAYLLDLFQHGQLDAICRDNGIAPDVVFTNVENFGIILSALKSSLEFRRDTYCQLELDNPEQFKVLLQREKPYILECQNDKLIDRISRIRQRFRELLAQIRA